MSTAFSVFTKIAGEDALSGLFRKVAGAAKEATTPVANFNKAVGEPNTTALGRVGSAVDRVGAKFRAGLGSISAWLPALGAIGSIASFGGLIAMTKRSTEGFDGLAMGAQKLGATKADLAVWRYGAKLVNVEHEALEKGLVQLNKRMYDAATGKNKDLPALFRAMGVPLRDAKGRVNGVTESLEGIAEAFKNTGNASTREAMAMALFGKAGADLIPFLIKGKAGIAELREEMKRYTGLTDEHRDSFERLDKAYKQLDKAGSGLSSRLAAVMAPAMIKIVEGTTNWIVANRELIAQSLERKFAAIGRGLEFVAGVARDIAGLPLVAEFLKGADASTAFDVGLAVLGATMVGPLFAALQFVTGAIWRMNAAVLANPVVAVAAVIIGVGVELVKHWTEVKEVFASAYERFGLLGVVFQAVNVPVNLLFAAINDVAKALFGIDLDAWGAKFQAAIGAAVDWAIAKLGELLAFFSKVWAPIGGALDAIGARWAPGSAAINQGPAFFANGGSPDFPAFAPQSAAPAPGAVLAAPPQKTEVGVKVDFANVPKGVETSVTSKGDASVSTNVGRSMETAF